MYLSQVMQNFIVGTLAVIFIMLSINQLSFAHKDRQPSGEILFRQYCQSCHPGGGNVSRTDRPIYGSKKLINLAIFKSYLEAPPGHMPYYQELVNDRKMLNAVYDYCKHLDKVPMKQAYKKPQYPLRMM